MPYKIITNVLDTDGDGIRNYLDYDDDNDGVFDVDDTCPQDPNLGCRKPITDTITANGEVWAQVSLFVDLSWDDINAVCPTGLCYGTLKGYDMNGWRWAGISDVLSLFNSYGIEPPLTPIDWYHPDVPDHNDLYSETDSEVFAITDAFFRDGWHLTIFPPISPSIGVLGRSWEPEPCCGLVRDSNYLPSVQQCRTGCVNGHKVHARIGTYSATKLKPNPYVGGWFFRE